MEDSKPVTVSLISPPSSANSTFTGSFAKQTRQRKPKAESTGIGVRRSARLLKGKK